MDEKIKYQRIYTDAIIRTMFQAKRPLTTNQIAKRLGISWKTSDKYLRILEKKGKVAPIIEDKKTYWKLKEPLSR